ncbi:nitrate/nitrite transporter NrtS [Ancylomarina longa]|uniref:nitrate/nitrite transporter NrtS n=1 Tax=Ancylomarina longa TaxID=2487017 RepID=UPI001ADE03A0
MRTKVIKYIELAREKDSLRRAVKVALLVGVILNMINNPLLFSFEHYREIRVDRVLLTFFVPFCVSLYSSVLANSKK